MAILHAVGDLITVVYAVLGIALESPRAIPISCRSPGAALIWFLWLAVGLAAILGKYRVPTIPDARLFAIGSAVLVAFVLDQHFAPERYHAEPLGLFVFIGCLGVIAVRRMHRNEQRPLSVEQGHRCPRGAFSHRSFLITNRGSLA